MSDIITLYHGSSTIINLPYFGGGRANNDFGPGFYCTESADLAKEWGCSSEGSGFANRYTLDLSGLNILNLNSPDYTIMNWITILVNHRLFRTRTPIAGRARKYLTENFSVSVDSFDCIIGYRADDSYFDYADAFLNNAITLDQLASAMKLGKLGEQFVVKSEYAFERLRFESAEYAEQNVWYPRRKARNDDAVQHYAEMIQAEADGLYMIDIIREKLRNEDERIPRNIP